MTEAMRSPHISRKKPGESVPNEASDTAEKDTINSEPNVTQTDTERVRAAFSTAFSGESEKNVLIQLNTSESSI